MANMSDFLSDKLAKVVHTQTSWTPTTPFELALYDVAPDSSDASGTEVSGGSYARQAIAFQEVGTGDGVFENDAVITFTSMPAVDVEGLAIFDNNGDKLYFEDFSGSPVTVASGDSYVVDVGDINVAYS